MDKIKFRLLKPITLAVSISILSGCAVCTQGLLTPSAVHNNLTGEYIIELQNPDRFRVHYDGDNPPRGAGDLTGMSMSMITASRQEAVYASAGVSSMFNETDSDDTSDGELDADDGDRLRVEWGLIEPFYVRANSGEVISINITTVENDPRGACEVGSTSFSFTVPSGITGIPNTCQANNTYLLDETHALVMTLTNWPLASSRNVAITTSGKEAGPELILTGEPAICLRSVP